MAEPALEGAKGHLVASFWDERYGGANFAYGTAPNRWLVEQAHRIRRGGRVLALAEGEGRNAVWLATQGYSVVAVDASPVGLDKARRLAAEKGVAIETVVADLSRHAPAPASFDAVVAIFAHLPAAIRTGVHAAAEAALVPGGLVIVEAFTPRQLGRPSGGPKQLDMLYEPAVLRADFPRVSWHVLEETEVELDEGELHQGRAAVVRAAGVLGSLTPPPRASPPKP